ncbi:hypothetical protein FB472_0882 [Rhodoglobus vestalii]|uniref:Uncharacterized protein n=1 Tax=Rhodoglobus vestalii TaxID=193384 RepID=A0A8H2K5T8_9MICO|nr:hypothetical protein [Rhodoglobus vestalii]TQO19338.1 hypothetical protein FB472_0882 [Rhodoglobus vestalii]
MRLFRRRPRLNLGKFRAPEPVEAAPIDRVVDEGVLIARNAVRMAVKNRIIVDAARDHLDYDDGALAGMVHVEFDQLAEQAERLLRVTHTARNRAVQEGLAEGLRQASMDGELISHIIDEARELAWSEIGTAIIAKLRVAYLPMEDPLYEAQKKRRLRELHTINFAELEAAAQGEY